MKSEIDAHDFFKIICIKSILWIRILRHLCVCGVFSFISAAPEIMVSVLKRPPTEYGYYFIMIPAGFMTGNYVARHYGRTISIDNMIAIGASIGVFGIVLALILQTLGMSSPVALFLPIALAVFGNGITLPNAQAAAINEFPECLGNSLRIDRFSPDGCFFDCSTGGRTNI